MTTRTIIAESMQQAMKQAKKELGDGAIILHSERFGQHIEVTVTDDMSCLQRHAEERAAKKSEADRIEAGLKAKEDSARQAILAKESLQAHVLSDEQKALLLNQSVNKMSHGECESAAQNSQPSEELASNSTPVSFSDALTKASALSQVQNNESHTVDTKNQENSTSDKTPGKFDWNKFSSLFSETPPKRRPVKQKTIAIKGDNVSAYKGNSETPRQNKANNTSAKHPRAAVKPTAAAKTALPTPECTLPIKSFPGIPPVDKEISAINESKEPALKRMIGDLKSIGEYWDSFGIYWDRYAEAYQYPWSKELRERLDYLHLSEELRESLIRQYREIPEVSSAWQLILGELSRSLEISRYDIIKDGGAYAFVGPAGAGKTTTIGKIAAEYVLRHGAEKVALISTDIFRIASYEQLLTIGRILDVDVEIVDAQQGGLAKALNKFSDKSLVLIDTAGLRRNDRDLAQQLAEIKRQGERLQTMLVLPGNLQYGSMQSCYESYSSTNFKGCVFTKLDECTTLGAAVSLAVITKTPVAYLASGHTIPDDLVRANGPLIIEQLLSFACQERDISLLERSSVADALCLDDKQQLQLI